MVAITLAAAIAGFGKSAKAKLNNPALTGAPEDQLRAPLEALFRELASLSGLAPGAVTLVGETTLAHLNSRPDYAVTVNDVLAGFIEVKAPGKGADPRRFSDAHDKAQWQKLKLLPNVLYTDGGSFTLWRDGEIVGKPIHLDGDVETAGAKLAAPPEFLPLVADFLNWQPVPPKTPRELAKITARLCRLLRDEVQEQLARENVGLRRLAFDWRALLFPKADDEQFADGYAQAVTFGLLIARANDIELKDGVEFAALKLKRSSSLIGTALSLLTEDPQSRTELKTPLDTLARVLDQVNWKTIAKDDENAWLYFYENFLEVYDNKRRKETGSYYTPPEVVDAMTRLVDEALRGPLFNRRRGLASPDVTIADPAVGTGTFILGALRKVAENIADDQGEGAVAGELLAAAKRIYGFELQFGPFAVAQLRILAELQALAGVSANTAHMNLYITDTLGNPFVEDEQLPQIVEPVARSRREANRVKRGQPITVVIGNPPYKEKAEGRGGWIEQGSGGDLKAPLDWWKAPSEWKLGKYENKLKNLYIYFWRWATLKVFGSGLYAATGEQAQSEEGLICFITMSGFLNGPAFEKMRDDLRRTCSDIWVIDCSPEGHQPDQSTRIFQAVQQPICIVLAARDCRKESSKPARVHYLSLPEGRRKEKFDALKSVSLTDENWRNCATDWRGPFLPQHDGAWRRYATLSTLFRWDSPGVTAQRTWPIAPDQGTLETRWHVLTTTKIREKKKALFSEEQDRNIDKIVKVHFGRHITRLQSIASDTGAIAPPVRFGFRSFDRQWIIPDHRLISRARPKLWDVESPVQVYMTCIQLNAPTQGPAITFTPYVPDKHHYKGSFGGRVYPLWADAKATQPNIRREALELLTLTYGATVSPEDLFAYIAGVMAHPAFTARFQKDLVRPGLRLPLTADAALFAEAAALGRRVVWLHCYGERFVDDKADRPKGPPRLPKEQAPTIPRDGAIPGAPVPLPNEMRHDPATNRLHIGEGYIANVTKAMWDYEISGKQVLRQWFSYRRLDRTKPVIGDRRPPSPLEKIQPDGWLPEYTSDLLDLLNVLGGVIDLHPAQADLLARICDGPLIDPAALREAGLMDAAGTPEEAADD